MKIWKIVSGGLSVALSVILIYQSFFSGVWDAMAENGQFSGAAGIAVALLLAVGGIVSIATCGGSRSGAVAMAILFGTGGVVGLAAPGEPTSLRVWAVWSLACAIAAMADIGTGGCDKKEDEAFRQWAAPVKPMRGPVTLNDVLAERDPRVRNAAVDALPEREAKNYLKQLLNVFVPRQEETGSDSGLVRTLIAILAVLAVFIVGVVALGIMFSALGRLPRGDPAPGGEPLRPAQPHGGAHRRALDPAGHRCGDFGELLCGDQSRFSHPGHRGKAGHCHHLRMDQQRPGHHQRHGGAGLEGPSGQRPAGERRNCQGTQI